MGYVTLISVVVWVDLYGFVGNSVNLLRGDNYYDTVVCLLV